MTRAPRLPLLTDGASRSAQLPMRGLRANIAVAVRISHGARSAKKSAPVQNRSPIPNTPPANTIAMSRRYRWRSARTSGQNSGTAARLPGVNAANVVVAADSGDRPMSSSAGYVKKLPPLETELITPAKNPAPRSSSHCVASRPTVLLLVTVGGAKGPGTHPAPLLNIEERR